MKRALLFFTLGVGVVALPQFAESQGAAAIQDRLRWVSSFAMSGALYHTHMRALGLDIKAMPPSPDSPPDPGPGPFPYTSYVATNDNPSQDVEPSVLSVWVGGSPYITTAYMSYSSVDPHLSLLHSVTTTPSFGAFTPATLSLPATIPGQLAFAEAYDPFLASSTSGQMYTIGVASTNPPYGTLPVTAVCVWPSSNGGSAWSAPISVENNSADTTYELDKPHITVNPNNGYVFVTYIQYLPPPAPFGQANIHVALSMNGGASFVLVSAPTNSAGTIGGPQVAVNPANSNLYLVWADYGTNSLRVSTSTDNGTSWSAPVSLSISSGHLIGPVAGLQCQIPNQPPKYFYPCLSNYIRVYSLPIARFNPVAGILGVTWHQREDTGTTNPVPTDTYYSYFNGSAWAAPVAVSAIAGSNEFMPALDSDSVGNVSITFYSTYGSIGNVQYREWRAFRSYSGTVQTANKALASLWSDPSRYTLYPYFIGDYQDATSMRGMGYNEYIPAWVGIDSGYNPAHGDIYLTDISY